MESQRISRRSTGNGYLRDRRDNGAFWCGCNNAPAGKRRRSLIEIGEEDIRGRKFDGGTLCETPVRNFNGLIERAVLAMMAKSREQQTKAALRISRGGSA